MEREPVKPDDLRFESLLREAVSRRDLPDGGFTARVMASIAPASSVMPFYRTFIVLGWIGTAAGMVAALWAFVPWSEISGLPTLGQSSSGVAAFEWTMVALAMVLAGGATAWQFRESSLES